MTEQRTQCPAHRGDTQGSDSYFFNESKGVGNCKSCGLSTWLDESGNLWGRHSKKQKAFLIDGEYTPVQDEEEYMVVEEPEGTYKPCRGVSEGTMEFWGVVTSEGKQYYQYPSGGYKVRNLEKKGFFGIDLSQSELFGRNLFPAGCAKKIVVTEGELDAMSAWQMLRSGSYVNPVVSVPSSTPSGKFWQENKDYLDSFDQILLSLDRDDPGEALSAKMVELFPGKIFQIDHFGYKDANEVLQAELAQEYKKSWWNPVRFKPEDALIDPEDYLQLYDESPDFEYFTTGIPELDEKILGINKGYFTVLLAKTGVGKTELMRYLEYRLLKHSNYKFGYLHLEESKLRSVLGLVSYDLKDNLTLKKFIDDKGRDEEVRESIRNLTKDGRMIQVPFKLEEGYEAIIEKIKFYKAAFDIDFFFFEPIQDVVTGEDKEGKLSDLSSRLGTLASEIDVGIVTIAHQNQNGETMYATMIGKKAAFEIILERDQEAEDPVERNRTYVKVGRKNRVGLGNGPAGALDFDSESYILVPVEGPKAPPTPNREEDF